MSMQSLSISIVPKSPIQCQLSMSIGQKVNVNYTNTNLNRIAILSIHRTAIPKSLFIRPNSGLIQLAIKGSWGCGPDISRALCNFGSLDGQFVMAPSKFGCILPFKGCHFDLVASLFLKPEPCNSGKCMRSHPINITKSY